MNTTVRIRKSSIGTIALLVCLLTSNLYGGSDTLLERLARIPKAKLWYKGNADKQVEEEARTKEKLEEEEKRRQEARVEAERRRQLEAYADWKRSAADAAKALDQVAKRVEEFGVITMSAPILAGPSADFTFKLEREEDEYFDAAKTQVEAAVGNAERIVSSLSGKVDVSHDQLALERYLSTKEQFKAHSDAKDLAMNERLSGAEQRYQDAVRLANALAEPEEKAAALGKAREAYEEEVQAAVDSRYGSSPPVFPAASDPKPSENADAIEKATSDAVGKIDAAASKAASHITNAVKNATIGDPPSYHQTTVNLAGVPAPVLNSQTGTPSATEARGVLEAITNMSALNAVAGADPKTPDRAALIQTAGNRAVHAIFEFLGDPNTANQFRDKQVMFGVSTIGVSPGWRTQRDFAADVAVNVSYEYALARYDTIARLVKDRRYPLADREALAQPLGIIVPDTISTKDGSAPIVNHGGALYTSISASSFSDAENALDEKKPIVSGVSPLMDTQISDLESQWRRQDEFAVLLSGLIATPGANGSANVFKQYLKNRQSDARSRTVSGVVNTYSAAGGLFGFQVGPRLQALADPATRKAGQGRVLERQSFPAAIIFGLDHNDIRPVICRNSDGRLVVYEPVISLVQTTRWTNVSPRFVERFVLWKPRTWTRSRWSEEDRIEEIMDAAERIDLEEFSETQFPWLDRGVAPQIGSLIDERWQHYSYLAGGAKTTLSIPASTLMPDHYQIAVEQAAKKVLTKGTPQINRVIPTSISLAKGQIVEVVLLGENLDSLITQQMKSDARDSKSGWTMVPESNLDARVESQGGGKSALILSLSLEKTKEHKVQTFGAALRFPTMDGAMLFSPPITISIPAEVAAEEDPNKPTERGETTEGDQGEASVEFRDSTNSVSINRGGSLHELTVAEDRDESLLLLPSLDTHR